MGKERPSGWPWIYTRLYEMTKRGRKGGSCLQGVRRNWHVYGDWNRRFTKSGGRGNIPFFSFLFVRSLSFLFGFDRRELTRNRKSAIERKKERKRKRKPAEANEQEKGKRYTSSLCASILFFFSALFLSWPDGKRAHWCVIWKITD